ncbi:hypothetical protein NQZ79_g3350 [Umbelopsis isabellina]|nr:hypothetical protein NQZ79_g3350 [Umbelopsis isabellina]
MTVTTNVRQGKPLRSLPTCFREASTFAKNDGKPSSSYTKILSNEARQRQLLYKATIDNLPVIDHRPSHKLYCSKSTSETNFLIKRMINESVQCSPWPMCLTRKSSYVTKPFEQEPQSHQIQFDFIFCREGNVFGLDLEWRPTFVKGSKENKTALIQLCNAKTVLIIQISRMHGDALKLYRDFRILTNGLVDLGALARLTKAKELEDHTGLSLRLLCGIFLGKSLPKGAVRLSRWDAPFLSNKQKQYAADDAYASFALYRAIDERRKKIPDTPITVSHLEDDKRNEGVVTTTSKSGTPVTKDK